MVDYEWEIMAAKLDGVCYPLVVLRNGRGGNGKSVLVHHASAVMGNFFYAAPEGLIKEADSVNSASPFKAACKNKRYINFCEVSGRLTVGAVRILTGGGQITARNNYENASSFFMQSLLSMEFNNPPELDGKPEDADYRRMRHINYKQKFSEDESKIGTTDAVLGVVVQRADRYLLSPECALAWRPVLLDMMLDVYKAKGTTTGIPFNVPQQVLDSTNAFLAKMNMHSTFFEEAYERTDSPEDLVKCTEIWTKFSTSDAYRSIRTAREKTEYGREALVDWLTANVGVEVLRKVKKIRGWKLRVEEESDDEDGDDRPAKCARTD
jgi:phage/plasmid-associated DNA primase